MEQEIIWNDENWTVDYKNGTIYKKAVTSGLPVQAKFGCYRLKSFKGQFYFKKEKKFYKIYKNQIVEVNKEEYEEIGNYLTLKKTDPSTIRRISNYVTSILIDELIRKKLNLQGSINIDAQKFSNIANVFSKKFPPEVSSKIRWLTRQILIMLPIQIKKSDIEKQVFTIYNNIEQESKEYIDELINNIYLNDMERFDFLFEELRVYKNRKSKKYSNKS